MVLTLSEKHKEIINKKCFFTSKNLGNFLINENMKGVQEKHRRRLIEKFHLIAEVFEKGVNRKEKLLDFFNKNAFYFQHFHSLKGILKDFYAFNMDRHNRIWFQISDDLNLIKIEYGDYHRT